MPNFRACIRPAAWAMAAAALMAAAPAEAEEPLHPPVPYRLQAGSSLQEGCFEPCLCPILLRPIQGGFRLRHTGSDWLFRHFDVENVRWWARDGSGARLRIRGSGTYRVGGEFAAQHQLVLDLRIGDQPPRRFDSGLVVGGWEFPVIDIVVSEGGMFCYDLVFELRARPAPRLDVRRERVEWSPVMDASGYDLVVGDLATLRAADGDYSEALAECLGNGLDETSLSHSEMPAPGEAFWFVLRFDHGTAVESYDSDCWSQASPRDPMIDASPLTCP